MAAANESSTRRSSTLRMKLGELLLEGKLIDQPTLDRALATQRTRGGRLGAVLVEMGAIAEETLAKYLGRRLGLEWVNLTHAAIPPETLRRLSPELALHHRVLPIRYNEEGNRRTLYVATADPTNVAVIDELRFATGCNVRFVIALGSQLEEALARSYGEVAPPEQGAAARRPLEPPEPPPGKSRERFYLQALIDLLVQKKVITLEEYVQALDAKERQQRDQPGP